MTRIRGVHGPHHLTINRRELITKSITLASAYAAVGTLSGQTVVPSAHAAYSDSLLTEIPAANIPTAAQPCMKSSHCK
jgi:hypothetical protein